MHRVAVVAQDGFVPFDLSVPCEVFGQARLRDGAPAYAVEVCAVSGRVASSRFELRSRHGLADLARADTIVIPGIRDVDVPMPRDLVRALRDAYDGGARLASVCTGAFVLAATGLLSGLRATTHWRAVDALARRHPAIEVDPEVLFVDNGRLLTSAGAAAGIDLCLHMVRRDHGAAVAADTARLSVVPLERDGGQGQFIVHPPAPSDGASLAPVLRWIEEHVDEPLSLDVIAGRAAMSRRTLSRRFREQTGTTPAQWVTQARIRRAQLLLETTEHGVDRVASLCGFGCASTLRAQFQRVVGNDPTSYRRMFRSRA